MDSLLLKATEKRGYFQAKHGADSRGAGRQKRLKLSYGVTGGAVIPIVGPDGRVRMASDSRAPEQEANASNKGGDKGDANPKNVRSKSTSMPFWFPERLQEILNQPDYKDCVKWNSKGDAFCILPKMFSEKVLPRYFPGTKFESFTRKLNRWTFERVLDEEFPRESLAYRHSLFQRDAPGLIKNMKTKSKKIQNAAAVEDEEAKETPTTTNRQKQGQAPSLDIDRGSLPASSPLPRSTTEDLLLPVPRAARPQRLLQPLLQPTDLGLVEQSQDILRGVDPYMEQLLAFQRASTQRAQLYGGNSLLLGPNPTRTELQLQARILQLERQREADAEILQAQLLQLRRAGISPVGALPSLSTARSTPIIVGPHQARLLQRASLARRAAGATGLLPPITLSSSTMSSRRSLGDNSETTGRPRGRTEY